MEEDSSNTNSGMASLSAHVKSYFAETSLHGLKYITEDGRVVLERLLWILLVSSGLVLAVVFMLPGTVECARYCSFAFTIGLNQRC